MKICLVIDPDHKTIEEVEREWTLEECQAEVGGLIEAIPNDAGVTIYVNQEGIMKNLYHFFFFPFGPKTWPAPVLAGQLRASKLFGKMLVFGPADRDGETTSITKAQINEVMFRGSWA